jgi:hypothetical protein
MPGTLFGDSQSNSLEEYTEASPGSEKRSPFPSRTRCSPWTGEEDEALREAVQRHGCKWVTISHEIPWRTVHQIASRWSKVFNPSIRKGSFEAAEDDAIRRHVELHGPGLWGKVGIARTPKQIRERYWNHLVETITAEPWTEEEDAILAARFQELGSSWRAITQRLPGRSESAVKNRFHGKIERQIFGERGELEMLILPRPIPRHAPRVAPMPVGADRLVPSLWPPAADRDL